MFRLCYIVNFLVLVIFVGYKEFNFQSNFTMQRYYNPIMCVVRFKLSYFLLCHRTMFALYDDLTTIRLFHNNNF